VLLSQRFVLPQGHPLAAGYDVVCCEQCGFVFADTTVNQRDYDAFYARFSKYEDNTTATGGGGSPEDAQRLQETASCLAEALPDRSARLLDIGCANGGLLKALRDLGYINLTGIDPSPVCVETTRQLCRCDVFVGFLSSLPAGIGEFDGVILSHVLEHVHDVQEAMLSLRQLIASGGTAYIEVPDASRYTAYYVSPFHYFDTEHINHFSQAALENLFTQHGLIVWKRGVKTTALTAEIVYPAVYAFTKIRRETAPGVLADRNLRQSIVEYIERSRSDVLCALPADIVEKRTPVIVWGVGCSTTRLLAHSKLGEANIVAFVDNNPKFWGSSLLGKPILCPSELRGRDEHVVVTSKLYGKEITAQLQSELLIDPARIVLTFIHAIAEPRNPAVVKT